ncbi:trimethylamine methyltransferase family protein [Mameliella sediminis]|uniref:trimethylamine methyltransferase family protein n=1 Tax=Mameliella sediminis TaxID=2836866 RepID=UPI001C46E01E|nr:trimethylamine methyltransferase family protein [Mameliella sediminis]MBV7393987.1 trimethylamine methyltransferase family protein [Mameliella sediminis]
MATLTENTGRRRRGKRGGEAPTSRRQVNYRQLTNPFTPQVVFSEDRIAAIHETALRVLEELGIKVLLPEARRIYEQAGCIVDEDSQMVRIGRDIVAAALTTAPRRFTLNGGAPERALDMQLGTLAFQSGAGAPNCSDMLRGRRPGSLRDVEELTKLVQNFDAIQMLSPGVEPQDIPVHLRHYAFTRMQLAVSDKVPFVFSRGTPQVMDAFEMIAGFRGLSDEQFLQNPHCYTIINTNSPRQIDIPMAQGLIDFARNGQPSVVTPFCLMGAMAPVTVAGAVTLSHAEAMAGITLTQLTKPGAPVCYGAFASNVDMKSGAPAFGTPEQVKASLASGQLARLVGLPWRNAAGCAANTNDAQAAHETEISTWGALMSGATIIIHAAGWIEGGLTVNYEKFITDMEMVQVMAELCAETPSEDTEIAFDALAEVQPGGHFFGCAHTMDRYSTAFYEPIVADWSNFGTWTERGGLDANDRAQKLWQQILADHKAPANVTGDRLAALDAFIDKRTAQGGAAPAD